MFVSVSADLQLDNTDADLFHSLPNSIDECRVFARIADKTIESACLSFERHDVGATQGAFKVLFFLRIHRLSIDIVAARMELMRTLYNSTP